MGVATIQAQLWEKPDGRFPNSYPMTSVEINGQRGCWEMRDLPTPSDAHSRGSWDKSKSPCPLRYRIIHNETTAGAPGITRPVACIGLTIIKLLNTVLTENWSLSQTIYFM